MLDINPNSFLQVLTVLGLAIIAVVVGYKKIFKDWKIDSTETSIITIMHKELERMSLQNIALSNEIGKLHQQIITLNKQLQDLSIENQRLQAEIIALTNKVSELKASMSTKGLEHATS
jgi:peptidoglycan hydrolase CwlO-like protein